MNFLRPLWKFWPWSILFSDRYKDFDLSWIFETVVRILTLGEFLWPDWAHWPYREFFRPFENFDLSWTFFEIVVRILTLVCWFRLMFLLWDLCLIFETFAIFLRPLFAFWDFYLIFDRFGSNDASYFFPDAQYVRRNDSWHDWVGNMGGWYSVFRFSVFSLRRPALT